MNNYIEHSIRVKYTEELLNHSQDWGWFVNYIEENFDLRDISSWNEFRSKHNILAEVLSAIIKITDISDAQIRAKSSLVSDLISVASFYIGRIEKNTCFDNVTTNYGHVLTLIVHITKLENSTYCKSNITDYSLLIYRNYWRLVDIGTIEDFEEEIKHISKLCLTGWDEVENVFRDNLNNKSYGLSDGFFERFGEHLYNANAFSYQMIAADQFCPWEEQFLLDMLKTTIVEGKMKSAVEFKDSDHPNHPDQNRWTSEILEHMKSFFHSKQANFVIESVAYFLHGDVPSDGVIIDHFKLLNGLKSTGTVNEIIRSSSFEIVGVLFKKQDLSEYVKGSTSFITMIKYVQGIKDDVEIKRIKDKGIPISKEQDQLLQTAAETYFNDVKDTEDLQEFIVRLQDRPNMQFITDAQIESINDTFIDLIEIDKKSVAIAAAFYEYMSLLIEAYTKSISVDKGKLHNLMINIQLLWELEYFEQQVAGMHSFDVNISIPSEKSKEFNVLSLESPLSIAYSISIAKCDDLCEAMRQISEYPVIYHISRYNIGTAFPTKVKNIDFSKHDVDRLLYDYVKWIKKEYSYKFINNLDENMYVRGILDQFRIRVDSVVMQLTDEYSLYKKVERCCDIPLIDYAQELKLAHLTQLFPILEIKLRDLARNEGYFPFKKNNVDFMQYNDPSSILREIITSACENMHGFDTVPDLYFIYNCMYNTNSLNIRNEAIHGRGYFAQSRLHYAFRITLLCILMVEQRLQIIFYNRKQKLKEDYCANFND